MQRQFESTREQAVKSSTGNAVIIYEVGTIKVPSRVATREIVSRPFKRDREAFLYRDKCIQKACFYNVFID